MIHIEANIHASLEQVWECFTQGHHIQNWNFANSDWHCPRAENDLKTGGKFCYTMAAKDGSFSFDFEGVFNEVQIYQSIEYTMADGRKAKVWFEAKDGGILVSEDFEPESQNSHEMQQAGWQAILNNFKQYTENK